MLLNAFSDCSLANDNSPCKPRKILFISPTGFGARAQVLSSKLAYPVTVAGQFFARTHLCKCRLTTQLLSAMSVLNLQSTGRYTAHSSKRAPFVPARGDRAVSQASCLVRQKAQLRTSNEEFLQKVSIHSACPSSAVVRAWVCNASSVPLC